MPFRFLPILLLLFQASASQAAVITFFPASSYSANTAAMNQSLGVNGFTVEDFEDTTLIPGLSISYTGNGFNLTQSSLPAIQTQLQSWDGFANVNNHPNNPIPFNTSSIPDLITFNFAGGASSVGIGLTGFQSVNPTSDSFPVTNHRLYINGVAQPGTLESLAGANWTGSRLNRNGYLRVDAMNGETIFSLGFENILNPNPSGGSDFLHFDHLAINAQVTSAPEPASVALWLAGVSVIGFCSRRSRGKLPR